MLGRGVVAVTAAGLLVAGCGSTHSAPTSTSTAAAASHVLKGCYSLPFSGGKAELLPVNNYAINSTPDTICFRMLTAASKCSRGPGYARSYRDPLVDTDEPRSGGYSVIYYASERRWFLVPGCPS